MRRFSNILCIVDPQSTSKTAIVQATRIADDHQAGITFMSVIKEPTTWRLPFTNKEELSNDINELTNNKRKAIEQLVSANAPKKETKVCITVGTGFIEIIRFVIHENYDLVVKCAEEMDWTDRMLASEDMHILRKCPCPVLMLKPGQVDSFRTLLASVDVNQNNYYDDKYVQEELNQSVLEYSACLSMPELSELHVASAWEAYSEDYLRYGAFSHTPKEEVDQYVKLAYEECTLQINNLVDNLNERLGDEVAHYLNTNTHLVKGKASKEIPQFAEKNNVDLIVMGTVGRVGIPGLIIGNTAESILEQAHCSILAIKPKGFKTPIV
ncbi:MAG: universal stress protein [Pseudomonadales bacterium]|nr:universal stress protein [Pseudomonadales bacterium]